MGQSLDVVPLWRCLSLSEASHCPWAGAGILRGRSRGHRSPLQFLLTNPGVPGVGQGRARGGVPGETALLVWQSWLRPREGDFPTELGFIFPTQLGFIFPTEHGFIFPTEQGVYFPHRVGFFSPHPDFTWTEKNPKEIFPRAPLHT